MVSHNRHSPFLLIQKYFVSTQGHLKANIITMCCTPHFDFSFRAGARKHGPVFVKLHTSASVIWDTGAKNTRDIQKFMFTQRAALKLPRPSVNMLLQSVGLYRYTRASACQNARGWKLEFCDIGRL